MQGSSASTNARILSLVDTLLGVGTFFGLGFLGICMYYSLSECHFGILHIMFGHQRTSFWIAISPGCRASPLSRRTPPPGPALGTG
jgi:hypothetical protein